jgi:PCFT/HCP family folate transporter-like MFS transporter 1/3
MIVFIIGLIAQILAAIWIIIIRFEKSLAKAEKSLAKTEKSFDQNYNHTKDENDIKIQNAEKLIERTDECEPLIQKSIHENSLDVRVSQELSLEESLRLGVVFSDSKRCFYIFNDLIDLQNIRDMFKTCTKHRSDGKRGQIWILFISLPLIMLTINGSYIVLFQFVQKVFQWNAEIYSTVNSLVFIMTAITVATVVPILIKVFKVNDISLSIIGVLSLYIQNLIRGTILNENAFYLSFIFGSLAYVPPISVRAKLSHIVDKNEENKVFGLLATFETLTPIVASIIYSTIFEATLVSYPGLVFQISCVFLLIPLLGFINISLFHN